MSLLSKRSTGMKRIFMLPLFFYLFSQVLLGQTRPNVPITGEPTRPSATWHELALSKQRGWDVGFALGLAHSLTDIGGTRDASRILFFDAQTKATGLHFGVFGRYRFSNLFALNSGINYGKIGGADSLSPVTSPRYSRAYHFQNNIYEVAIKTEFYLPKNYFDIAIDLYAYTGIIGLYHAPRLIVPNPALQQPETFSNYQLAIPFGVGFHYTTKGNFKIGFNVGWRKTFTDYLDAESPVPGPKNDSYFFNAINIGYYFARKLPR